MSPLADLRGLTGPQWRAFAAAYLGWMLDAFDYFILVFMLAPIAADVHTDLKSVTHALALTLAMRPVGGLIFGLVADRLGRRPALMASILLYAVIELLSGFAPSLGSLLFLRALFGIGMGGEWGVGASLAMESVPARSRGVLSGILQQGYPAGYLLAALANEFIFPRFGWRGMFFVGAAPAVLVVLIRMGVAESPAWIEEHAGRGPGTQGAGGRLWASARERWPLLVYMVLLMAAFNAFSHGTQDLYPSGFLRTQRGLPSAAVSHIAMIASLGAITGGFLFGALSQRFGRRRAIAAAALLALPTIPLWLGSSTVAGLAAGGFLIQFAVQGAWGVVPVHLNELSPGAVRGTFPGLAYQLGNLCASYLVPFQASLAESHGGNYAFSLGWVVAIVALVVAGLALAGPEARTARLAPEAA